MALAAALQVAFGGLAAAAGVEGTARALGGAILLASAVRVMVTPPPVPVPAAAETTGETGADLLALLAGLCTAATNPITAAYFAAQALGPLAASPLRWAIVPLAGLLALGFGLLVAGLFAPPAARRLALRHHRAACLASGTALAALAALILTPLLKA
jgi:hypothetical protein